MDSPGSDSSSDSSDSSTADPTPADSCPPQTPPGPGGSADLADMDSATVLDNHDSDSDVSMSADSDDESEPDSHSSITERKSGAHDNEQPAPIIHGPVTEGDRKRKYSDCAPGNDDRHLHNGINEDFRKRMKPDRQIQKFRSPDGSLPQNKSLLPAEIWHYIFSFCPPRALGSLLQANKTFNAYLDSLAHSVSFDPCSEGIAKNLQPEAIWRASRLHFRHGMPGPLAGKSELDMWKLACGTLCQFCNKKQPAIALPGDQWHPGPGENGVAPIWTFGIRACGSCLDQNSSKEIDLLLSSSIPSPLMAALPFVFLTNELHVLPPSILQNGHHPSTIQIAKRFSKSQIKDIKQEFDNVKNLGSATAEEWLKGLDERGKERRSDAARWERWEAIGGVANMRKVHHETPKPEVQNGSVRSATTTVAGSPATNANSPGFPFQTQNPSQQSRQFPSFQAPRTSQPGHTTFPTNPPARFDSPSQNGFAPYPPPTRPYPQPRQERTKEEVAQLKAARRAEIERRCMLLEPPLTAGVLAHMSSFQAAIQIIQPLDDGAWEVLKPRLLSQRGEAEQRENDRLAQTRVVQERSDERRFQDIQTKPEVRDLVDREWDDIQAPLRARIGGYADEIIRDGWNGGDKVNYDDCPKFAADVLIYVRKRFYAEIAKDEAAVRATGQEPEVDPPNGPYLRRLILENMKWVFDTKIKPHTEPHRKELFLCNACEGNLKYYGFEGVIQHYAAKHTSALSLGSIVVHWKSEWPEHPPFNPDPTTVTNGTFYPPAPSASVQFSNPGQALPQNYQYGGYQPTPASVPVQAPMPAPMQPPMSVPNPHVYQETPGPYYGHPQFGDQYSRHQNGPYPPPQPYPDTSQGYQNPQYSMVPPTNNTMGYGEAATDYSQHGYGGGYPPPGQNIYHPNQGSYPSSIPEVPVHQQNFEPQADQYGQPYNQQPSYATSSYASEQPKTEEYKIQLQNIARTAREVWNVIGSVKEVPGSVKVYTIIYHFLQSSRAAFPEDPSLLMVIDGLNHHKEMRACRNINGLLCRACVLGLPGSTSATQKKHFSFPQLLNHFRDCHAGASKNSRNDTDYIPDWTRDMIELPDASKLASLMNSTEQRLKFVREALPDFFATPLPQSEDAKNGHRDFGFTESNSYEDLIPSHDNHDKYYTVPESRPSNPTVVPYDNGEYDPRNPQELPLNSRPVYKPARRISISREYDTHDDHAYRYIRREDDYDQASYQNRSEGYVAQLPTSPPLRMRRGDYERVLVREEGPVYVDRRPRYREVNEFDYRVRREPPPPVYEDREPQREGRAHRLVNDEIHRPSIEDYQPPAAREDRVRDNRSHPVEGAAAQQDRIFEVVAQISQQAQQARERLPPKEEPEVGSEDGEVRAEPGPLPDSQHMQAGEEATKAADRFLDNFLAEEPAEAVQTADHCQGDGSRTEWEPSRNDETRYVQQTLSGPLRRVRDGYEGVDGAHVGETRPSERILDDTRYVIHERQGARQARAYVYEDRYVDAIPEQRERSPELVDRRYKLNNVVYRDERQSSYGAHRTPSRYARYESVRLENDRARSRSPVYVKMGGQHGQIREHSPVSHHLPQEPVYRSRTPRPTADEGAYERVPRQEYQRVYIDEPRPREPQYAEAYELVRVSDSRGEYMIRRPIRRETETVYAPYEEDKKFARQPVYESRPPISRPEKAFYEEEYDPRHPQAPQPPPIRQVTRY